MKKIILIILTLALILTPILSFATDYTVLTDDDLLNELNQIRAELLKRTINPDKILCESDGVTISLRGEIEEKDSYRGKSLVLNYTAVNNSEKQMGLIVKEICVNGWEIALMDSITLDAGKKTMGNFEISDIYSKVDFTSLEEIEDIEFYYYTFDAVTYYTITDNLRTKLVLK